MSQTPQTARQARLLALRSALAYGALLAGVLFVIPGVGPGMGVIGACIVTLGILLGWRDLRRVPRLIFILVVITTVIAVLSGPVVLIEAANNMTRLTALIVTVILLSSVLGKSRDLGHISKSLFAGKSLSRYYSITFGTAFLAMPLNFGSVAVVSAMIGGEIKHRGDTSMTRNASRSVLRGFGAAPIFSPLSISIVLTLTFLPGLQGWQLIALSLPLAMCFLLSGAFFRESEPIASARETTEQIPDRLTRLAPWLRFAGIIGAICIGTFAFSGLAGLEYSRAVTLSCLGAVIAGLGHRRWWLGQKVTLPSMAPVSNELAIIGGSAFVGTLISTFAVALLGDGVNLPGWGYPVAAFLVPWTFFLGGLVGLNPIIIGTLMGGVLGPIWPTEALLGLGIAMVSGWGLTTTSSPYSANALLLERLTGYNARVASIQWNLAFAASWLLFTALLAAALTFVLAG